MTSLPDLRDALDEAEAMPYGDGKLAELERITAHADAAGDVRLGYDARIQLIETYAHHTERWRMLPAFGWCLAAFDRDPSMFDEEDAELLRWFHKWAVATLRNTPRVGLAQTVAALDDMERRFRAGGHSMQAIYNLRCRIADHLGDQAEARRWFDLWRTAERDENSDCAGCDPSRQADLLAGWGEMEQALHIVEPVLSGIVGCAEQPEKALVVAQMAYLKLGRYDEAARAHVRSYRRHRHERDAFPFLAEHIRFCALTGHVDRGLDILTEHLSWLDRPYDESSAMEFAAAGALVCRLAGDTDRVIHRPSFENRAEADLTVAQLGADLAAQARDIADRFDARNGTDHQSRRVALQLAATPIVDGIELPPDRPSSAWDPAVGLPPEGRDELVEPLTVQAITAILNDRGDRYVVNGDGSIGGQWGEGVFTFDRMGERGEVLLVRVVVQRTLPADRLMEAYAFCNAWNHDRVLPKAYVHDTGEGELILAGDITTDLEHGVAAPQLAVLLHAAIMSGAQFAEEAMELPR
ncbi:YbjN domain-containing protein [Catellatospora tritici]|uniref:YbjN domain-containing protein n=1 Tax=Catellatospora tritici TaxID=2851566 RepID=UPI001C2DC685|nr:YbjN domain-containing protein [Catellatospora tritici]MBV1855186.1 YbjN domain-containing protein [Catellatospora tritici]